MIDVKNVLEFIKNSNDKMDLKSIYNAYAVRMSEIRQEIKDSFRVGDVVGINHKKIPSDLNFRIIKINPTNIKVKGDISTYTVSPSLLVKR